MISTPLDVVSELSERTRSVRFVLTDLDDTLTNDGLLTSTAYQAIERLCDGGYTVVVVTGRPAGWCDLIARLWPVGGVVGENGAFYFSYDRIQRAMTREYQRSQSQRSLDRIELLRILEISRRRYPQLALSADQDYRVSDLAIDVCEDVEALPPSIVAEVMSIFSNEGAIVRLSSIHINAWIGTYSKVQMSLRLLEEKYGVTPEQSKAEVIYVGDSPNDAPMFEFFPLSVGVSNVQPFLDQMSHTPRWICRHPGGEGFAEMVRRMIGG